MITNNKMFWTARRSNKSILKAISSEYLVEGLMLKLKLQYFGHLDVKSWFIWKDPDAGKDWGQEKKGMTEDEMVGWHHRLNRHGFGWNLGVGDGQGGLACCSSWGCKESHTTEQLNWTEWNLIHSSIHPTNIFKCLRSTRHCCRYGTTVIQGVQNMPLWYKNDFELKAQISYLNAEPPKRTEKKKKPPLS